MTEISTSGAQPASATGASGVEAELVWTVATRPPEVTLAFDGLNEPTGLFADLHGMGWSVPPVPPRPGSAIEWVPDPSTGQDFTIRNWRVKEFRLAEGSWWTPEQAANIGAVTIEALRRHGANIVGLRGEPITQAAPAAAQAAPAAAVAAAPAPAAAPPAEGAAVLITVDPSSSDASAAQTWIGESGRKKDTCLWTETGDDVSVVFPTLESYTEFSGVGGSAWILPAGSQRPHATSKAKTVVQMIVPHSSAEDPKIKKLAKLMGEGAVIIPLEGVHNGTRAAMFCATVATNSVEMLTSNLRLRCPQGIVRVEA